MRKQMPIKIFPIKNKSYNTYTVCGSYQDHLHRIHNHIIALMKWFHLLHGLVIYCCLDCIQDLENKIWRIELTYKYMHGSMCCFRLYTHLVLCRHVKLFINKGERCIKATNSCYRSFQLQNTFKSWWENFKRTEDRTRQ